MRDVTLYETKNGLRDRPGTWEDESVPVPAVVGITVAEIERERGSAEAARNLWREAERERDDARAEAKGLRDERDEATFWAGRYREALERIESERERSRWDLRDIAREALGGGDG